jgi:penicillin amidase
LVSGALLVGAAVLGLIAVLRGSLAQLDGERPLPGLSAAVTLERDSLGVVTITASNRLDVTRALGFVHAQERFFQMDLLRRSGAGELAALFGPAAVELDQRVRLHRPRASFRATWEVLPADQRETLIAYAAGVNAGLAALTVRPPEYLLLRAPPEPWLPEDTLAVNLAMRFVLEDAHGDAEIRRALLRKLVPDAAFEFFGAPDSGWDAAIDGTELPLPAIPSAREFGWRGWSNAVASQADPATIGDEDSSVPGSNSWAERWTGTLANDMHLSLGVPGIWFRARLRFADPLRMAQPETIDVNGFTLPGTPAVVVGSNRKVAWGFTAAGMDQCDLVELNLEPGNPRRYQTPDGWKEVECLTEKIVVRGGTNVPLMVTQTVWGPLIEPRGLGGHFALAWTGTHPAANNVRLLEMERAVTTWMGLLLGPQCGIANNNLLVSDKMGDVGWTLTGRLPDRQGFRGDLPVAWTAEVGWRGLLNPSNYPRIFPELPWTVRYGLVPRVQKLRGDPSFFRGRLWTANSRVAGSKDYLPRVGADLQDFGARAYQIRQDLFAKAELTEQEHWDIYRDDRALYLDSWQRRLVTTLERGAATNAEWQEALGFVKNWGGRAAAESVGYRLVAGFHRSVDALVFEPLVKAGRALNPDFRYRNNTVLEMLVSEQPAHLLNPRFQSYEELFAAAAEQVFASLREQKVPLAEATWGRRNLLNLQHPIARAIPALSGLLNMPRVPMNGAPNDLPKIQGSDFGPSERMVVSPGHEERGLCNQPAGQSGHFLSPFYRAGHEAWVKVEPLPFLPGPTQHRVELKPTP